MNELRQTTLRLTARYSLVFFGFIWLFTGGIYLWVDNALGEGYVSNINHVLELQSSGTKQALDIPDNTTASVAADVALDRLRNILLVVNLIAIAVIPYIAYRISRRTLLPLIEGQRSQRRFIANASHELRTPLAVMLAELDWAEKQNRPAVQYKETIRKTREEVLSMTKLVQSLLTLTRLADAPGQISDPVDLAKLALNGVHKYERAAKERNVTFQSELQPALSMGSADLLAVAIGNLIDNAVKYAPPNSAIEVMSSAGEKSVRLRIANKADDLTPADIEHLFDRFYRASAHDDQAGFGLGLALAKQIVKSNMGTLEAKLVDGTIVFTIVLKARSGE
ncbi:MAG TPA: HAMP domain-containing sensor histidine kinase [Candidatus Saccharimonadia bacterium]|jgi:signal transduction histidine kinase